MKLTITLIIACFLIFEAAPNLQAQNLKTRPAKSRARNRAPNQMTILPGKRHPLRPRLRSPRPLALARRL